MLKSPHLFVKYFPGFSTLCFKRKILLGWCYLDKRHPYRILFYVIFDGVTHSYNKLVRNHEDQDVSSFHRLDQVWNSHLMKERSQSRTWDQQRDKTRCMCRLLDSINSPRGRKSAVRLTTLGGNLWPGRYFTFSWSVLMISVSLRPFTVSSNTHMFTVVSNLSYLAALAPTILAMAEPLWTWWHRKSFCCHNTGWMNVLLAKNCSQFSSVKCKQQM